MHTDAGGEEAAAGKDVIVLVFPSLYEDVVIMKNEARA
jgi:hypothetical protein